MNYKLLNVKSNVKKYIELLKARDALDKISKGFSYITNDSGQKIRSVNDTKVGAKILSRVKGGTIESKVEKIKKNYHITSFENVVIGIPELWGNQFCLRNSVKKKVSACREFQIQMDSKSCDRCN